MKSLHIIQKIFRTGRVLSKIAFVFSVIGFCGCAAGLLSLNLGGGNLIKIGGVTLHGLVDLRHGGNVGAITAALAGGLILCAGEAVLARFAEICFKNEGRAGTPFTQSGAKELTRLGILALTIPAGSSIVGSIVEGIVAGGMNVETDALLNRYFDPAVNIAMGVMFLLIALLCRYGAELRQEKVD
ncbi:MAG: hypothetical protein Q4C31_07360 [Eubacteriales bacterium]|nr:hypothetical protein [Eubacteriales bacterium]